METDFILAYMLFLLFETNASVISNQNCIIKESVLLDNILHQCKHISVFDSVQQKSVLKRLVRFMLLFRSIFFVLECVVGYCTDLLAGKYWTLFSIYYKL
jgi:hypothetical protein